MKNFHLPLPETTYEQLRSEAERTSTPATALAREAIDAFLKERKRAETDRAVTEYALAVAGTVEDLDPDFEAASIESWLAMEKRER